MTAIRTKRKAKALLSSATAFAVSTFVAASAEATAPASLARVPPAAIPAVIDPVEDLGRQAPGPQPTWSDSIRLTGSVRANGQEFGIQVRTRALPGEAAYRWTFAVVNKKTGWYEDYDATVKPEDFRWAEGRLDIKAPGLSWTGDANRQRVQVETPWGALDVRLVANGPALNYASIGLYELADGVSNHQFALPEMRTSGTLTVEGKRHQVTGACWVDRQWGEMPRSLVRRTWMSLTMPNGDKIAIWDTVGATSRRSWATVLHPDGSYEVVGVEPLERGVRQTWTSRATRQTYPTRWRVRIPALRADLDVRIVGTPDQELRTPDGSGCLAAAAAFTGTYRGQRVGGDNHVEMTGEWK
jgi:hypothetical protein